MASQQSVEINKTSDRQEGKCIRKRHTSSNGHEPVGAYFTSRAIFMANIFMEIEKYFSQIWRKLIYCPLIELKIIFTAVQYQSWRRANIAAVRDKKLVVGSVFMMLRSVQEKRQPILLGRLRAIFYRKFIRKQSTTSICYQNLATNRQAFDTVGLYSHFSRLGNILKTEEIRRKGILNGPFFHISTSKHQRPPGSFFYITALFYSTTAFHLFHFKEPPFSS